MEDEELFEDALEEPDFVHSSAPTFSLSPPDVHNNNILDNNNCIQNSRNSSPGGGGRFTDKYSISKSSSTGSLKKARKWSKKDLKQAECEIPLTEALEDAKRSVDMFLDNKFEEAKNICLPLADRSIYHALGYGMFMYLKAVMTFEQKHIEEASQILSDACETINQFRRRSGIAENLGRIVRKVDYDQFSEVEMHAELCYAECLLLKAALTFCEDETLVSFVKAGLKVRTCYQSFRECWSALTERNWGDSELLPDFESGVRSGVGMFNLMISLLPGRVMKLLEFIGFEGNRETAMRELMKVYNDKGGMRHSMGCFMLLGYNLLMTYYIGSKDCDLELCKEILDEKLKLYPNGAFFKFFKGRYHFIQGDVEEAMGWYELSVKSQNDWPQFHHICFWELYWSCVLDQQWAQALHYADCLYNESKWSPCMYAYQKAAVMCMIQDQLTPEQRKEQIELMESVPRLKQRIAGKSLPMEKFAVKKAERFLSQGNYLALPAFEMIYMWGNCRIWGHNYRLAEAVYVLVEKKLKILEETKDSVKFFNEDYCLLNLLLAMCLKFMKSPLQAEECLKTIIGFSGRLQHDSYLVPYALFEYGLLLRDQGLVDEAMFHFESAKNDFKDYSLLSRLHFRIHSAQNEIRKKTPTKKEADVEVVDNLNNSSSNGEKKDKKKKKKKFKLTLSGINKKNKNKEKTNDLVKGGDIEDEVGEEDEEEEGEDENSNSFQDADDVLPLGTMAGSASEAKDNRANNGSGLKVLNEEEALKIIHGP